jgi:SAM-dependent methyltransferase
MVQHRDWNENYETGDAPWDTGSPDPHLVELVESGRVPPGRTLEIGCGTGTNVLWLAARGFEVTGVDLASRAIELAGAKAAGAPGRAEFRTLDFLADPVAGGPFAFAFDRGCFHVFDEPAERTRFAARVAGLLGPKGLWLSLIGSTEGAFRDTGPPRRSVRDIALAIEPALEIVELRAIEFEARLPSPPRAWFCLARRREVPAAPSTSH